MDLALNNRQWLICHKTKQNQTLSIKYPETSLHAIKINLILSRDTLLLAYAEITLYSKAKVSGRDNLILDRCFELHVNNSTTFQGNHANKNTINVQLI